MKIEKYNMSMGEVIEETTRRFRFNVGYNPAKPTSYENFIVTELTEGNINNMKKWIDDYEVAFIAGSRREIKDIPNNGRWTRNKDVELFRNKGPYALSKQENVERDNELDAAIQSFGLKRTNNLKGLFPEGGKPSWDYTFFVWNENKNPDFYNTLFMLSEWYNQDNFLYKAIGSDDFYFIGTNNSWPGYGKKELCGDNIAWNTINKYMTQVSANKSLVITSEPIRITQSFKDLSEEQIQSILTQEAQKVKGENIPDNTTIYNLGNNPGKGYIYQYDAEKSKWRFLKRLDKATLKNDIKDIMKENNLIYIQDALGLRGITNSGYSGNTQQVIKSIGNRILCEIKNIRK